MNEILGAVSEGTEGAESDGVHSVVVVQKAEEDKNTGGGL